MRLATWQLLDTIRRQQHTEYGKLVQKLLALAFLEAGARRATDRAIQGIDLEIGLGDRHLALEVKTCEADRVVVSRKDVDGLDARRDEGFETYLAVLGGRRTDAWLLLPVPGTDLKIGSPMEIALLRPFADRELGALVAHPFEEVVDRHGPLAASDGQAGLNRVLEGEAGYRRA